jgi:hypothetical protein
MSGIESTREADQQGDQAPGEAHGRPRQEPGIRKGGAGARPAACPEAAGLRGAGGGQRGVDTRQVKKRPAGRFFWALLR